MTTFTSDDIELESAGSGLLGFSDLLLSIALVAVVMLAVNLLVLSVPHERSGRASGLAGPFAWMQRLQAAQTMPILPLLNVKRVAQAGR